MAISVNDQSGSSWADMEPLVIGTSQMHPLTLEMQQRLILQYLTPMGEYQEVGFCFDKVPYKQAKNLNGAH